MVTGVDRRASTSGGLSITIDVEDHAGAPADYRFREAMRPLIDGLREQGVHATFFVVGTLASEWKEDMRELAAEGHEIGLHGFTHTLLAELGPARFADELERGRDLLAGFLGEAPMGFRAPYFSLTKDTPWAPELIAKAGFLYSSSVLPAWNPQAGLQGAPRQPFRWQSGVIEFPSPVFGLGRWRLPILGGAYLRLAPAPLVRLASRSAVGPRGRWTYSHPYDFDVEERFMRRDGQSWPFAKLLFARRHLMMRRVLSLTGPGSVTLRAIAADPAFRDSLPQYSFDAA
jgi:hypothetical protein